MPTALMSSTTFYNIIIFSEEEKNINQYSCYLTYKARLLASQITCNFKKIPLNNAFEDS